MATRRGRVLLVDDDACITEFVRTALEDEGYAVETAGNGAVALRLIAARHPDVPALILLDVNMPVMDGPTFASACRRTEIPHAPILCITAGYSAAQSARAMGADDYLGKPFKLDDLLDRVERLSQRAA